MFTPHPNLLYPPSAPEICSFLTLDPQSQSPPEYELHAACLGHRGPGEAGPLGPHFPGRHNHWIVTTFPLIPSACFGISENLGCLHIERHRGIQKGRPDGMPLRVFLQRRFWSLPFFLLSDVVCDSSFLHTLPPCFATACCPHHAVKLPKLGLNKWIFSVTSLSRVSCYSNVKLTNTPLSCFGQ